MDRTCSASETTAVTTDEALELLESIQRRMEGTTEDEVLAAVASARAEIKKEREVREAALRLLSEIHEKMAGVSEDEVLAILEAENSNARDHDELTTG